MMLVKRITHKASLVCIALIWMGLCVTEVQAQYSMLNVREMGAKGDGVADDTPIFQQALDLLADSGGSLFIPKGRYRITQTLRVSGSKPSSREPMNWIEIRGEGEGSRLLGDGIDYILGAKIIHNKEGKRQYINGLRVDGIVMASYDMAEDKRCGGIDASYLLRWSCHNSHFIGLKTGIYSAARDGDAKASTPVWIIRILNNHFNGCLDYGIKMGRVFDLVIANNIIEHGRGGIAVGQPGDGFDAAANTIRIVDNVIEGLHAYGKPAILGSCWLGGRITGNYFEENHAGDIVLTPAENDGWGRGLVISSNTFQPTASQRESNHYGPIRLTKTMDAVITGNFTTSAMLIHPASQSLGGGINIASNILRNPPAVGAMDGAEPAVPADYFQKMSMGADTEKWEVAGPAGRVGIHAMNGFTYQPHGEAARSIVYGHAAPSDDRVTYQPGSLIINLSPGVEDGKLLFGWLCVTAGKPGTWKPLHVAVE